MKIGIMSDSHGSLLYFNQVCEKFADCDYILHAGDLMNHGPRNPLPDGYDTIGMINMLIDWPMRDKFFIARGNVDNDADEMTTGLYMRESERFMVFKDIQIFMTHGYLEPLEKSIDRAQVCGCDLFISGHTHVKVLEKRGKMTVLNPGSITLPRDGSRSYAILDGRILSLWDLDKDRVIQEVTI